MRSDAMCCTHPGPIQCTRPVPDVRHPVLTALLYTLSKLCPIPGGSQGSGSVVARALDKLIKDPLASCRWWDFLKRKGKNKKRCIVSQWFRQQAAELLLILRSCFVYHPSLTGSVCIELQIMTQNSSLSHDFPQKIRITYMRELDSERFLLISCT